MTTLQLALAEKLGIKQMTLDQQIWQFIKNNPWKTYKEIAKATGINHTTVSSRLHYMELRGMIYPRGAKGNGPSGKVREWSTDMTAYTLLPLPTPKAEQPVAAAPPPKQVITIRQKDPFDLDNLTVGQARALYLKLAEMFG